MVSKSESVVFPSRGIEFQRSDAHYTNVSLSSRDIKMKKGNATTATTKSERKRGKYVSLVF